MKSAFVLAFVAACSSDPDPETVKLGTLTFDVPAGWARQDFKRTGATTATFVPEGANDRKQSLSIVRSELSPVVAKHGADASIEQLLAVAQGSLRNARVSQVEKLSTTNGLSGARIEVDYQPPGLKQRYHRSHVVLVDRSSGTFIHVMYTALDPDGSRAIDLVLNTIRNEAT